MLCPRQPPGMQIHRSYSLRIRKLAGRNVIQVVQNLSLCLLPHASISEVQDSVASECTNAVECSMELVAGFSAACSEATEVLFAGAVPLFFSWLVCNFSVGHDWHSSPVTTCR